MKKKLEADLISIAHKILQLKNKSDINQLYIESQKVYEKLAILRFVGELSGGAKPTIDYAEIDNKIESFYDTEIKAESETELKTSETEIITEKTASIDSTDVIKPLPEILIEQQIENPDFKNSPNIATTSGNLFDSIELEQENLAEPLIEEKENEEKSETIDEIDSQETEKEPINQTLKTQESLEEILGSNYRDLQFVKKIEESENLKQKDIEVSKKPEPKLSLNDKLSKKITVDLNDQIAFTKHLFRNSLEDYNRVLNQLTTFNDLDETLNFIENIVKPDYNNWEGKDEYVARFINVIEKKFL